jgi:ribosome-associated protein
MPATPEEPSEGPSKSQRKRDMLALQELGAQLTELTPAALKKCQLPEALLDAIQEHNRLPNRHGARKRQLQYIGKVMRDMPDEVISRITEQLSQNVSVDKRRYMALENLRARLLDEDAASLDRLLAEHPEADAEQIRILVRQAREEEAARKTPLASRQLFQLLRKLHGV